MVDHVLFLLGRAYYAYVGLLECVLVEQELADHVRPGMGHILFALFEQDDRTIGELAGQVQMAGSTLTGLADRMERAGLIERQRDRQDGRLVRIRLTHHGRSLQARCYQAMTALTEVLHRELTVAEVGQAKGLLQRFLTVMRAAEKERLATRTPKRRARMEG